MTEGGRGLTHQEAWELLPWLVNDTLDSPEREGVAAHVATCLECRAEAERCHALAALVASAEVAPSPHPAQLAKLLRRVDEIEGSGERLGGNIRANIRASLVRLLGSGRVSVGWAVAAQAATLVLLLGVIFWPSAPADTEAAPAVAIAAPAPAASYVVLGDPSVAATTAAKTHQVRVVFVANSTEAELRRLLLEIRGELIGGPSPLGAYVVAVPVAEPLELVLEHLRADSRVRFAEPVAGEGGV